MDETQTRNQSTKEDTPGSEPRPRKAAPKKDQLVRMLRRKTGATVPGIGEKLGWQAHTVRAALSRLRSAGFVILREEPEKGGPARYRIRDVETGEVVQ